ncbi:MAG: carbohydrate kinase family protein, partial [Candidatus Odinarchaeia archaeon]
CYVSSSNENHMIPSLKVEVKDTTGAGDAFTAGFISGLLRDASLYEAGLTGILTSALTITKIGARNGLPTLKELINFAKRKSLKLKYLEQ